MLLFIIRNNEVESCVKWSPRALILYPFTVMMQAERRARGHSSPSLRGVKQRTRATGERKRGVPAKNGTIPVIAEPAHAQPAENTPGNSDGSSVRRRARDQESSS